MNEYFSSFNNSDKSEYSYLSDKERELLKDAIDFVREWSRDIQHETTVVIKKNLLSDAAKNEFFEAKREIVERVKIIIMLLSEERDNSTSFTELKQILDCPIPPKDEAIAMLEKIFNNK